jgi:hypothetical protein
MLHPEINFGCKRIRMGAGCAVIQKHFSLYVCPQLVCLTAGVTRKWAGVDKVWEREQLEATPTA